VKIADNPLRKDTIKGAFINGSTVNDARNGNQVGLVSLDMERRHQWRGCGLIFFGTLERFKIHVSPHQVKAMEHGNVVLSSVNACTKITIHTFPSTLEARFSQLVGLIIHDRHPSIFPGHQKPWLNSGGL
jgi:hypothetical protein